GKLDAAVRVVKYLPRARNNSPEEILSSPFTLSEAQFVVAREAGFSSWPRMKHQLEASDAQKADVTEVVIDAAFAGNDDLVRTVLLQDRVTILRSIHASCAIADADSAIALIETNTQLAKDRGGSRKWPPALYLCCSRYRRGDAEAAGARVRIAR